MGSRQKLDACLPVTPAMVRGCAPKTENMKAAMNEDIKTSATPYCAVVSIRSNEKAMPGKTLQKGDDQINGLILN